MLDFVRFEAFLFHIYVDQSFQFCEDAAEEFFYSGVEFPGQGGVVHGRRLLRMFVPQAATVGVINGDVREPKF